MTKSDEPIRSVQTLNEIIENAKELPLECQEQILDVVRGMVFTKKCMEKKMESEETQNPKEDV